VVRDPANAGGFAVYRLEERGGKTYVSSKPVTLGDTFGNSIEITSGASAGERIVVLGAELLRSGQQVQALP
jgi:multidrug efflux pump subunit AcrA (membrane-fusion protein)